MRSEEEKQIDDFLEYLADDNYETLPQPILLDEMNLEGFKEGVIYFRDNGLIGYRKRGMTLYDAMRIVEKMGEE